LALHFFPAIAVVHYPDVAASASEDAAGQ